MMSVEASRVPASSPSQLPMEPAAGEKRSPAESEGSQALDPVPLSPAGPHSSSALLLRRRRRLKRNVSANPLGAAAAPSSSSPHSPAAANLGPGSRSLDRKSLLKAKQWVQLPRQDKEWVRGELRRGCVHIYHRHSSPGLRPLLCTLDTTARQVAARLLPPGGASTTTTTGVLRVLGQASPTEPQPFPACAAWISPHNVSRPEPQLCWQHEEEEPADSSSTAVCQGLELFHCGATSSPSSSSSSVEELSAEPPPPPARAVTVPARPLHDVQSPGYLYVQLHGESSRRLEPHERPLHVQNDYLFQLGFRDLCRVQEEGMEPEIGCLIRFYAGKPNEAGNSDRTQLSGMYNVRKGKMQLPVNRWTRRHVILCGTCLIVSSVKESQVGKMHVLPLIGGKVEEVKKHQHCLAFSSSGPQSQTYYVCFDTFTDYLRWLRQASKDEPTNNCSGTSGDTSNTAREAGDRRNRQPTGEPSLRRSNGVHRFYSISMH